MHSGARYDRSCSVVGAERIIEEVMFDRPDAIEPELVRQPSQTDLLLPGLAVAHAGPAIGGKDHLNADVHAVPPTVSMDSVPMSM